MNNVITNGIMTIPELENYTESFIKYLDVDDKTLRAYKVGIMALKDFLRNNKNEDYCVKRIGDVLINVNKIEQDQEYFVSVSKEHYDTIIPYNKLVFGIKAKNFEKDYSF